MKKNADARAVEFRPSLSALRPAAGDESIGGPTSSLGALAGIGAVGVGAAATHENPALYEGCAGKHSFLAEQLEREFGGRDGLTVTTRHWNTVIYNGGKPVLTVTFAVVGEHLSVQMGGLSLSPAADTLLGAANDIVKRVQDDDLFSVFRDVVTQATEAASLVTLPSRVWSMIDGATKDAESVYQAQQDAKDRAEAQRERERIQREAAEKARRTCQACGTNFGADDVQCEQCGFQRLE